ncbi:hypothetical protein D3C76_1263080 [compost metagenome]
MILKIVKVWLSINAEESAELYVSINAIMATIILITAAPRIAGIKGLNTSDTKCKIENLFFFVCPSSCNAVPVDSQASIPSNVL